MAMLDDKAKGVVADALKAAGYRGVWIHSMSRGSDVAIVVSSREVETADFTFGRRVFPRKGCGDAAE